MCFQFGPNSIPSSSRWVLVCPSVVGEGGREGGMAGGCGPRQFLEVCVSAYKGEGGKEGEREGLEEGRGRAR